MRVVTRWPALVPAIERAGHEAVVVESEEEMDQRSHAVTVRVAGFRGDQLSEDYCTARPRGARR
jgi:hypothetical protein